MRSRISPEFVLGAVKLDGYSLQYADETLLSDREIVLEAIKQNGEALELADAKLIDELKEDGFIISCTISPGIIAIQNRMKPIKIDFQTAMSFLLLLELTHR